MSKSNIKYLFTQNRDLSWMKFNQRVLDISKDKSVPLLERLKFLSITTSNFDEFFMIRLGSLLDIASIKPEAEDSRTGLNILEQIQIIFQTANNLYRDHEKSFNKLTKALKKEGVDLININDATSDEKRTIKAFYQSMIEPVLSPQVVDHNHPFPHLESKKEHIGLLLKSDDKDVFGLVPIPQIPPLLVLSTSTKRVVFVRDILFTYIDKVFDMFEITEKTIFTVTRNADIQLDESYEDTQDLRIKMKELLKKRKRLSVVRLETSETLSEDFTSFFKQKFNIETYQIFQTRAPFNFEFVSQIRDLFDSEHIKSLSYKKFKPHQRLKQNNITQTVLKKDILLTYPYDAFDSFLKLMEEASLDSSVLSIKITIYRLARRAKLIDHLVKAAENGKDVTVVIELKARFDEQNNIDFSEILELAGCKVMYGIDKLKIHSKLCVITRQDKGQIKHITQIGTGNFNETTVKQYTDFGLMTAHQGIAKDALKVFQSISLNTYKQTYDHLLVAPKHFKDTLLKLIENEIEKGRDGYMFFKINSITDVDIIKALVKASQHGVKIEMFVRSICCILPGVKGYTEHITIRSIVGRFLEHTRLYAFGRGFSHMYIGSADFMTRNTERRVEVAAPIYDENIKMYMASYIDVLTSDDTLSKEINSEGDHKLIPARDIPFNSQTYMMEYYLDLFPREKKWFQKIFNK